jgi:hypothetical protein
MPAESAPASRMRCVKAATASSVRSAAASLNSPLSRSPSPRRVPMASCSNGTSSPPASAAKSRRVVFVPSEMTARSGPERRRAVTLIALPSRGLARLLDSD